MNQIIFCDDDVGDEQIKSQKRHSTFDHIIL